MYFARLAHLFAHPAAVSPESASSQRWPRVWPSIQSRFGHEAHSDKSNSLDTSGGGGGGGRSKSASARVSLRARNSSHYLPNFKDKFFFSFLFLFCPTLNSAETRARNIAQRSDFSSVPRKSKPTFVATCCCNCKRISSIEQLKLLHSNQVVGRLCLELLCSRLKRLLRAQYSKLDQWMDSELR